MPRSPALALATALALVITGCASGTRAATAHDEHVAHDGSRTVADPLAEVARVHGGAGPFAVAGYRMGQRALRELGLPRGSFDVTVQHESPREVQYSCIADGAQAATGASVGRLNLSWTEVPRDATRTVFRARDGARSVSYRLTQSFLARYRDTPRERLAAAGAEVIALRDDEIFEASDGR